jgi:hypothetical protein
MAELEEAVSAYGKALEVYNREHAPLQWAAIAGNQAVALSHIAERQNDIEMARLAVNRIEAAITAFRDGKDLRAAATMRPGCPQPKSSRSPRAGLP